MEINIMLGPHKFSLQAFIDHHGLHVHPGICATSVNCCDKAFYFNNKGFIQYEAIATKTPKRYL